MMADTLLASFIIPVGFYLVEKFAMRFSKQDGSIPGAPQAEPAPAGE